MIVHRFLSGFRVAFHLPSNAVVLDGLHPWASLRPKGGDRCCRALRLLEARASGNSLPLASSSFPLPFGYGRRCRLRQTPFILIVRAHAGHTRARFPNAPKINNNRRARGARPRIVVVGIDLT
ncbi:MAG: hypothetical protein WA124_11675 [Smithella sp.]